MAGQINLLEDEQVFLREELKCRLYLNTKQYLSESQYPKAFNPLLDDMVKVLGIKDSDKNEKESDSEGYSFEVKESATQKAYYCSSRSLRDFFYQEKSRIDQVAINTYYAYLTKGTLLREDFLKQYTEFFVCVSDQEYHFLTNKVWNKVQKHLSEDDTLISDNFEIQVIHQICKKGTLDKFDVNINTERLSTFFNPDIKGKQLPVTSLNSLYYYISDNQFNRSQFLNKNPTAIPQPLAKEHLLANDIEGNIVWFERPEVVLCAALISLSILLFFILFRDNFKLTSYTFALLPFMILILSLSLFFFLRWQAQKEISKERVNTKVINNFWFWWFDKLPLQKFIHRNPRVRILLMHDNSFEIQKALMSIRNKFKIVSISEIVCTAGNIEDVKKELRKEKATGLYFFLTEDISLWAIQAIDEWSLEFEDLPIVYVDFIGTTLQYGRVLPKEAGTGLWQLLSQALNRTGIWKYHLSIYKKFTRLFAIILIAICILFLTLLIIKDSYTATLNKEIEKINNSNMKLQQDKFFFAKTSLIWQKKALINGTGFSADNLNLSVFRYIPNDSIICQIIRTDEEPVKGFRIGSNKGVVTFSNNEDWHTGLVLRDSITNIWPVRGISPTGEIITIPSNNSKYYTYRIDTDVKRQYMIQGIMCVTLVDNVKSKSKITICVEIINDKNMAEYMLYQNTKITYGLAQTLCSEFLNWEKMGQLEQFPRPNKEDIY